MTRAFATFATRLTDIRFVRYVLASVGALAADMAAFLALLGTGLAAAPASAAGYTLGILVHWLLSSRAVFADGVAAKGLARTRQKALFVISALVGLALTTAIVGFGVWAGANAMIAKLVAIALSFLATWLMRSHIVFRPGPPEAQAG